MMDTDLPCTYACPHPKSSKQATRPCQDNWLLRWDFMDVNAVLSIDISTVISIWCGWCLSVLEELQGSWKIALMLKGMVFYKAAPPKIKCSVFQSWDIPQNLIWTKSGVNPTVVSISHNQRSQNCFQKWEFHQVLEDKFHNIWIKSL